MLIARIINFFRGYINITLDGYFIERFINICIHRNIDIWDIKKLGTNRMKAKVTVKGFKELRFVARKTKTHISIVNRYGFPFLLHKYRKRKIALIGAALFFVILWYCSSHIMGIDISGNERISSDEILSELNSQGLTIGKRTSDIDEKTLQNQMTIKFEDIAWIGINIKGSRAYIEVKERLLKEGEIDKNTPCNIIAEKSGIIEKIYVRNGQTVVKLGELVEEGDLLVSGITDSDRDGARYVHSYGEVFAKTTYTETSEFPLEYEVYEDTNEVKNRYAFEVLGFRFNLFSKKKQPFEHYKKTEEIKEIKPPFGVFPSIGVYKYTYVNQNITIKTRSESDTLEYAKNELTEQIKKRLNDDAEICETQISYERSQNGNLIVTAEIKCFEDIAKEYVIDKSDILPYDIIEEKNPTSQNSTEDIN